MQKGSCWQIVDLVGGEWHMCTAAESQIMFEEWHMWRGKDREDWHAGCMLVPIQFEAVYQALGGFHEARVPRPSHSHPCWKEHSCAGDIGDTHAIRDADKGARYLSITFLQQGSTHQPHPATKNNGCMNKSDSFSLNLLPQWVLHGSLGPVVTPNFGRASRWNGPAKRPPHRLRTVDRTPMPRYVSTCQPFKLPGSKCCRTCRKSMYSDLLGGFGHCSIDLSSLVPKATKWKSLHMLAHSIH